MVTTEGCSSSTLNGSSVEATGNELTVLGLGMFVQLRFLWTLCSFYVTFLDHAAMFTFNSL